MDDKAKVELVGLLINAVIKNGVPAVVKIADNLRNKNKITSEDIDALRIDLDSETFFEGV